MTMRADAVKLYDKLCKKFDCSPNLEWLKNRGRSRYEPTTDTIEMAKGGDNGHGKKWKYLIVHEFAHALDEKVNHERQRHHDHYYYETLLKVIDVVYKHRKQYPWTLEYERIYQWAIKDGNAKKPRK